MSAVEFRCHALIFMLFNEVPPCSDVTDGIRRRLLFTRFARKAVEEPNGPFQIKADDSLNCKFNSKEYGACFLALMIATFQEHGFSFPIP